MSKMFFVISGASPGVKSPSNKLRTAMGVRDPNTSRAVKGPVKRKITVPGDLPCRRSILKAEPL